jgi:ferritin-like protein
MDLFSIFAVVRGWTIEYWRIMLIAASGVVGLMAVVKIIGSAHETQRAKKRLYQDRIDEVDKTLSQILRELQDIRYAIYDLKVKDESFMQKSEDG